MEFLYGYFFGTFICSAIYEWLLVSGILRFLKNAWPYILTATGAGLTILSVYKIAAGEAREKILAVVSLLCVGAAAYVFALPPLQDYITEKTSRTFLLIQNESRNEDVVSVRIRYTGSSWREIWTPRKGAMNRARLKIPVRAREFALRIDTQDRDRGSAETVSFQDAVPRHAVYNRNRGITPEKDGTAVFTYDGKSLDAEDASLVSDSSPRTDDNFMLRIPRRTNISEITLRTGDGKEVRYDENGKKVSAPLSRVKFGKFHVSETGEKAYEKIYPAAGEPTPFNVFTYKLKEGDYTLDCTVEYAQGTGRGLKFTTEKKIVKFRQGANTGAVLTGQAVRISGGADFNRFDYYVFEKRP